MYLKLPVSTKKKQASVLRVTCGAVGKCRTCSKHLTAATAGKGTVQRANLFAELRNKEFTTTLKREKLVSNEILAFGVMASQKRIV